MANPSSLRERVEAAHFLSKAHRDLTLNNVKKSLISISAIRNLTAQEQQELDDIEDFLLNPEAPPLNLTARQLKRVLANSSLGDAEVTKWQTTQRFQDKIAIENLVRDYRPNGAKAAAFATHMQGQDST